MLLAGVNLFLDIISNESKFPRSNKLTNYRGQIDFIDIKTIRNRAIVIFPENENVCTIFIVTFILKYIEESKHSLSFKILNNINLMIPLFISSYSFIINFDMISNYHLYIVLQTCTEANIYGQ